MTTPNSEMQIQAIDINAIHLLDVLLQELRERKFIKPAMRVLIYPNDLFMQLAHIATRYPHDGRYNKAFTALYLAAQHRKKANSPPAFSNLTEVFEFVGKAKTGPFQSPLKCGSP